LVQAESIGQHESSAITIQGPQVFNFISQTTIQPTDFQQMVTSFAKLVFAVISAM